MRLLEKIADPHLVVVHRVVESRHRVRHFGDEDHEEENVSDIELPGAAQDPRRGVERTLQLERAAINQSGCVTGDEDKDFRCIVELNRLNSKVAEDVLWNMVDKYKDQSETTKEVETEIARLSSRHG